ncbi:MAG: hypothetical protein IKK24_00780, partial [Clostridia bacterium]|nr:hypothetical protein [Clostridia bacterium]
GNWEINSAIRIPSNFSLVLDGCHLRMADNTYSNLFVNEHHDTKIGKTIAGTDRNISIIGKNGAVLDGGKYNGLSERNHSQNGMPPIWKNNLILFTNVDGFEISGISCHNQRWWALNFIYCANGNLHDIDIKACDIGIDENGNEYHGLKRDLYEQILVKNADGIDLRQGCHDIVIENITGFTEDDSVAITALNGMLCKTFKVEGLPSDICNITVKNIRTAAYCTNVRLLNQGGTKLHDIYIDGVYDTSKDSPHTEGGIYGVRVGDTHLYGDRHATEDETYNITIKNVRSGGVFAAVGLAGKIKNLVIENIETFGGAKQLEDKRN